MGRLRKLIADLALVPRIWRALVQEAREEIQWDLDVAASTAEREQPKWFSGYESLQ